jgi:hypothetical protein
MWELLLPQLSEWSGFTPELIEQYLRGDYELPDLIEGAAQQGLLPRSRAIITFAKFQAWLQELSLNEVVQILKDTAERAGELASPLLEDKNPEKPPQQTGKTGSTRKQVEREEPVDVSETDTDWFSADEDVEDFQVTIDQDAVVNIIFDLTNNLSFEKLVQVDNRLRDLIFFKLQQLGLLEMKKYQNNPFYILMEQYRINQGLSYEQFEERLLKEGIEAGLYPSRIPPIVRGKLLPDDRELLWMGIFIKKPDGSLYEHEELIALRDGIVSPFSGNEVQPRAAPENDLHHWGDSQLDCEVNGKRSD